MSGPGNCHGGGGDGSAEADGGGDGSRRFFRRRGPAAVVLAVPFFVCLAGSAFFLACYHWPRANAYCCLFSLGPPLLWFGLLLPGVIWGFIAVRPRWVLVGLLLWLVMLFTTEEIIPCIRPFAGAARREFAEKHAAFVSRSALAGKEGEIVWVPLRVVSWNVSMGQPDPQEAIQQLERLDPDLILFQEYSERRLGKHIAASPLLRRYRMARSDRKVVLSRFPLLPLPRERRSLSRRMEIAPGLSITCISVHLPHRLLVKKPTFVLFDVPAVRKGIEATRRDLERLRETVMRFTAQGPVIMAGDFNIPGHYPDLATGAPGLKDAFRANGYGWGKTVPNGFPVLRIDLAFVPEGAKVCYAGAVTTESSDHRMVLVEMMIPVPRRPEPADEEAAE